MLNIKTFDKSIFCFDDINDRICCCKWRLGDDVEEVKYFLIILKCGKKMRTQSYVYEEFDGNAILYLQYINDRDPYRDINSI